MSGSTNKLARLANIDDNDNNSYVYGNSQAPPIPKKTHHGHSHDSTQMNMRGAFLHVMSDALGSVIVIISALVCFTFLI